ncbi:hypothetical protein QJS66_12445 [Kocuria rhizophila]|nr:hypothetical protein QJS66_12445 [Kocuria rhizophila]
MFSLLRPPPARHRAPGSRSAASRAVPAAQASRRLPGPTGSALRRHPGAVFSSPCGGSAQSAHGRGPEPRGLRVRRLLRHERRPGLARRHPPGQPIISPQAAAWPCPTG